MGYTHYWYRPEALDPTTFTAFAADVRRLYQVSEAMAIPLAAGLGTGDPVATEERVIFNGRADCGHTGVSIGIPWPAPQAAGVQTDPRVGAWFAGTLLSSRACNGDCSYETFAIRRRVTQNPWDRGTGLVFACCKTAYRPYDVTVTAALIAFKRHFGDTVRVSSDGDDPDWEDGRMLTEVACGYGRAFHIVAGGPDGSELREVTA